MTNSDEGQIPSIRQRSFRSDDDEIRLFGFDGRRRTQGEKRRRRLTMFGQGTKNFFDERRVPTEELVVRFGTSDESVAPLVDRQTKI